MKNFIFKILALTLIALLVFTMVSCNSESNGNESTSVSSTAESQNNNNDAKEENRTVICSGGKSEYIIVIPQNDEIDETDDAAMKIALAIDDAFGCYIKTVNDSTTKAEYEIVIGATNRYSHPEPIRSNEYIIRVEGNSVIIFGGSYKIIEYAAQNFVDDYVTADEDGNLSLPSDLYIYDAIDPEIIKEEKPKIKVTVATFNIKNGNLANYDYSILAKDIVDSGADIVGLQEIDQNTKRNQYQDTMKKLSEETGFQYYVFGAAIPHQGGEYGNAILSKYPIEFYEVIQLPKLTSSEEQRVLLHAVIDINGTSLDFFTTHIQGSSASEQFEAINKHTFESDNFVLVGDFNKKPTTEMFSKFKNTYIVNQLNDSITHTTIDNYDFDNIVIFDEIKSQNTRVIDTKHSDHYMLLTEILI